MGNSTHLSARAGTDSRFLPRRLGGPILERRREHSISLGVVGRGGVRSTRTARRSRVGVLGDEVAAERSEEWRVAEMAEQWRGKAQYCGEVR